MSRLSASILEDLRTIPLIDAHTHVRGHFQCEPPNSVMDLLLDPYIGWSMAFADRPAAAIVQDRSLPDERRWRELVRVWPYWKSTGYGAVLANTLRLWGLASDNLTFEMFAQVEQAASQRCPQTSEQLYREAKIEASLSHYLGMPNFGVLDNVQEFLDGNLHFEKGFFPQLGTLPLHEFHSSVDIDAVSRLAQIDVIDLNSLVEAVQRVIEQCAARGIVGFKDHRAYTLGLEFSEPDRALAKRELAELLSGETYSDGAKGLSDYVFDHILKCADGYGLPMAFHSGYRQLDVDRRASVQGMSRVMRAYPNVSFDAYHLNYPYFDDHLAMAKSHPNMYSNCCWAHIIDPAYTIRFVESAIGAIPANHVFAFGSDFAVLPEATIAHLDIARNNLALAFANAIEAGRLSRTSALEIARMWLYDNPREVYALP